MKTTRYLLSALLGGAIGVALSCTDPSPVGVTAPQGDLLGLPPLPAPAPPPSGLLQCSPLAADSVTQTIGPAGGTIALSTDTLVIPAGALDSAVTITAVAPSDTVNRIQFQPQGLTFAQPASLTMSYANCNLLGWSLPKQIVYTTDLLVILETLQSVDNPPSQTVTGQLQHFSDYAIAW